MSRNAALADRVVVYVGNFGGFVGAKKRPRDKSRGQRGVAAGGGIGESIHSSADAAEGFIPLDVLFDKEIPHFVARLYLALVQVGGGKRVWLSNAEWADLMGMSVRTVVRGFVQAEKMGLITTTREGSGIVSRKPKGKRTDVEIVTRKAEDGAGGEVVEFPADRLAMAEKAIEQARDVSEEARKKKEARRKQKVRKQRLVVRERKLKRNSADAERYWMERVGDYWPKSSVAKTKWTVKDKSLVKAAIRDHGFEFVLESIDYLFRHWSRLKLDWKIQGKYPNVSIWWGFRSSFWGEAEAVMLKKKQREERKKKGEADDDLDGWWS